MADGQVVYEIRGDSTKFNYDLDAAEMKARKRSAAWSKIGRATGAAFLTATTAIIGFGAASIKTGMEFDSAISQIAATMGITVEECEELREAALDAGATTVFTAIEAAEALNYMALAGYDSATAIAMLPNVLSLAAAGEIDLAYASDMITDSQTALGLSLEETTILVDQMAKAASESNTSVEQLGEAILTVGGTARYMAGGTEELIAVLGVLADNGIKGSEAGTHLRNMLLSLSAPTDDAQEMLDKLGVKIFNAKGEMRSFTEIFPELNAAMADFTDQEKLDAFSAIFNVRDIASATALLSTTTERWEELGAAIEDSAGAAEQMAATKLDNLAGDIEYFTGALDTAKTRISDHLTPSLREFVQYGTGALDELVLALEEDGLAGALGIVGEVLSEAVSYIVESAPQVMEAGMSLLGALATGIISNLPEMFDAAMAAILMFGNGLIEALPELVPTVIDIVLKLANTLVENLDTLYSIAPQIFFALCEGLMHSLPILLEKGPEIIIKFVGAILGCLGEVWNSGVEWINSLSDGLSSGFDGIVQIGKDIINGLWSGIQSGWQWLKNKVYSLATSLYAEAKKALGIASPSKKFREIGMFSAEGMAVGIEEEQPVAEEAAREMAVSVLKNARVTADVGVDTSGVDSALSGLVGATITTNVAPIIVYSIMTGSIDVDGFQLATIMLQNMDDAAAYTLRG